MRSSLLGCSGLVVLLGLQSPQHARIPEVVTEPWVELRLTVDRPVIHRSIFDDEEEDPGGHVTIRNRGPIPLRLLAPQDGSDAGWRNPSTRWSHADGTFVDLGTLCGFMSGIDERDYFTLAPGESREIAVRIPLESGENRVRMVYDISADRENSSLFGMSSPEGSPPPPWPEDRGTRLYRALTPIRATSNLVSVMVRTKPGDPDLDPPSRH